MTNQRQETIMNISKAIQTVKDVGLNVYTPRSKDSGFIKVYTEPLASLIPKISGNALKVLMTLAYRMKWDEIEVIETRENLARLTGLSQATVRTALDELEQKMVIKRLGPNVRRSYTISSCYIKLGK